MAACPSCGEANPARARFCLACGRPLGAKGPLRETRKTVTIVFCDVVDSTPLGERLDAEAYRRVISRYFIEVSRVVERHGGIVEKFIGDAVMAVFGIPTVHEDDALRAVRAAVEVRDSVDRLNERLRSDLGVELTVRLGVNTGEVVAGDPTEGQAFATGEAVSLAERLEGAAGAGEILIGEATHRLVRDAVVVEALEPLELKGKAGSASAWKLLDVVAGAPAVARRLDSPLVGRERELALLEQAFHRAVDERACHLFTVFGVAGVGKSRLVNELVESLEPEARVLIGRCVPYGEGMTFWPLREMLRQAGSIGARTPPDEAVARIGRLLRGDPDAREVSERLAASTGLAEGKATNEETFWAVRKLFEGMAAERPLVVVFDDVQWAAPAFLDLADHIADSTRNAAVLVVCLARPDLLDDRPGWGGGKMNASAILLEPLRGDELERLIQNLLDGGKAPPELVRGLREAGEGNPLFVEEMLSMLVDQGRLTREDGLWRAAGELAQIEAPPTIQALLAARLDRLGEGERDAIGRAAVIGKVFSREAISALAASDEGLDECLAALVRKDLIRPDRTAPPTDEAYRFRHILIRDAAYQRLPKEERAELHEQLGDWLQGARAEREYEEVLGFHLEQAHRYRQELWSDDDRTRALAVRAAAFLSSAGRRAIGRGDMAAAAGLLTRATLLLRDDDRARLELAPDLGLALSETGQLDQAGAALAHASAAAAKLGDRALGLRAELERSMLGARLDPGWKVESLQTLAEEAIRVFEAADDEVGLARAWTALSFVHWVGGQWGERAAALEQALLYARRAGDRRQEAQVLGALSLSMTWGATPVSEAIARCEQWLAEMEGEMRVKARVLVALAELRAQQGSFEDGRRLYGEAKALTDEYGLNLLGALQTLSAGGIELLAGDAEAAEEELRRGYETLERFGEKISLPTHAAFLAEALYRQGRLQEAADLAEAGGRTAPAEDLLSHALVRGVKAKILARRGEVAEAERLAREAVALSERGDAINLQGDALMNLGEVLRAARKDRDAQEAAERAARLYEQKGNVVSREQAETVAALATKR